MKKQYGKGSRGFGGAFTCSPMGEPYRDRPKFRVARQMELESILLLKNEAQTLPLKKDQRVALLGNGFLHLNTGANGSGGGGGPFEIPFFTAMTEKQLPYCESLASYYCSKHEEGRGAFDDVHGWDDADETIWGAQQYSCTGWNNAAPIAVPELKLPDALVDEAAAEAHTALLFLSRTVGCEEMDRGIPRPSDWYLNPSEEQLIRQAVTRFDRVVLIVNASGSIDFSWMDRLDPQGRISAIVYSYGSAAFYGDVLTDLLYGDANFSAKLTDTITRTIEAHHTTSNFGGQQSYASNGAKPGLGDNGRRYATRNGENDPVSVYQEYVYMGYRYFDTFRGSSDDVLFPFGFGLSYSDFRYEDVSVTREGDTISVSATIRNVSQVPGKAVLEVYVSNPNDGALDQPYQRLMSFAKTDLLAAGASERVCATFTLADMASYSEALAAYILEPGRHLIRIGGSSRSTFVCGAVEAEEQVLIQQLKNRLTLDNANPDGGCENQKEFDVLRLNSQRGCDPIGDPARDAAELAAGTVLPLRQADVETDFCLGEIPAYQPGQAPEDRAATLQAVAAGEVSLADFTAQLTDDELICLMAGGAGRGVTITCPDDPGVPLTTEISKPSAPNSYSSGAGTSRANSRLGIPSLSYCDGSYGISITAGAAERLHIDPNVSYPKAPGIAASWNPALHELWGRTVATELHDANVDVWLAPTINLHRNPLNGRNPEYYSEDPVLSGRVARTVVTCIGEAGLTVCCKHFAGNDQEQFRRGRHTRRSEAEGNSLDAINSITSERALREVTLKPFEMAVRTGHVYSVMSAFNKINGQYCASSSELLTDILRGEWGFRGFVVTDWGDYDEIADGAEEMAAGNDVIMSGVHTRYSISDQCFAGLADGRLSRTQLLRNAEHLLTAILHSRNIFADGRYNTGSISTSEVSYHETTPLRIKTTMLPPAIIGHPYEQLKRTPLFAGGSEGTTRYIWSIAPDSALSADAFAALGLTLHASGAITGSAKPGTAGDYEITFRVTGDNGFAEKSLPLSIREITIQPEVLPELRLGIPFSEPVHVFCGESDVRLSLEGELPRGLHFDAQAGLISGLPEKSELHQTRSFTIRADGPTVHGARTYTLCAEDYIDIAMQPAGVLTVEAGTPIRMPFRASRGIHESNYYFSLKGAPDGLRASGMRYTGFFIDGTLSEPGTYSFFLHAEVEDSIPLIWVDYPCTVTVTEAKGLPLQLDPTLPHGQVTQLYSAQLAVSGGEGVKRFSLIPERCSAQLPAGFSLSESGQLQCAPQATESGLYTVAVRVTDAAGSTAEADCTLFIGGILHISPAPGEVIRVAAGEPFALRLSADGGFTNQFRYRELLPLPAGVTLSSEADYTGLLQGTLPKDRCRIVIEVDESFSGSPVTSVFYCDLISE